MFDRMFSRYTCFKRIDNIGTPAKSYDYKYDDYQYDGYHENYDYDNQKLEDYTDEYDYNQDLNDYHTNQNLLAPLNPPPPPPPLPPQPPMVMRYMLATGYFPVNQSLIYPKTQIVDVSNPTKSCELNDDITDRSGSTGGMLGTTPVICGGNIRMTGWMNECILYGTSQVITMTSGRSYPSSVVLNNSMLWVMGGQMNMGSAMGGWHVLDSTEFVTTEGAVNGPKLPESVMSHCSVHFPGNGNVYVIGGLNASSQSINKVWVANPSNKFTFAQGPSLITARYQHNCGIMSIGTKSIIVVAGGIGRNTCHSSVEILDPLTNQWVAGPELPYFISAGAMASSPDGKGVILFGGKRQVPDLDTYSDILELRSDGKGWVGSWTTLTAKLKYPRFYHVVIPIFMEIEACESYA